MTSPDPSADFLRLTELELLRQCEVDTFRGSGPGGQKRNRTESAVRLRHHPTGLAAQSDATRSQHKNRQVALRLLRQRIALTVRRPVQIEGYVAPEEVSRLLAGQVGRRSPEYHVALAALLDLLVAHDCSVRDTARQLGVRTARLARVLLADEKLGQTVNRLRGERGLRPLR